PEPRPSAGPPDTGLVTASDRGEGAADGKPPTARRPTPPDTAIVAAASAPTSFQRATGRRRRVRTRPARPGPTAPSRAAARMRSARRAWRYAMSVLTT